MRVKRLIATGIAAIAIALLAAGCSAPGDPGAISSNTAKPTDVMSSKAAMASILAYEKAGLPDLSGKKVAYLSECVTENNFCQTRLGAVQDAAKKMKFTITIFNGAFSTDTQLQQVQDAIQRGFDAYIFAPVADAAGCSDFKMLQATGKPIVTIDSPMCGDSGYTPGTVGYVSMTSEDFYVRGAEDAFASCKDKCDAIVMGGSIGTDIFTRWERAIKTAEAKYPNVTVVADQPADFSPAKGLSLTQDALSSHPDLSIVFTQSDDISRGAAQAIVAAGKTPGKDVRIFSTGGDKEAVDNVANGTYNATNALLPYDEGYYPAIILGKAMATGKATPGFTDLAYAPSIVDGPGSPTITAKNVSMFKAQW